MSRCGSAFTVVALSWLVLDLSGPRELGLVLLCSGLPVLACGPIAGQLLDRFPARLLLGWDNALRGVLIVLLMVLEHFGQLQVVLICAVAAASAALGAASEVAAGVLVPRLVEDEDLEPANSLLSVNLELAAIAGPPVAGALIGTAGAGGLCGVLFALPAVTSLGFPDVSGGESEPARRDEHRRDLALISRGHWKPAQTTD